MPVIVSRGSPGRGPTGQSQLSQPGCGDQRVREQDPSQDQVEEEALGMCLGLGRRAVVEYASTTMAL